MGNGALAIGPKLPRPSSTLPQVGDALVTRHEIKPPDGRIEPLRPADIRRFEIDTAQCRDCKMGHCGRCPRVGTGHSAMPELRYRESFSWPRRTITYRKQTQQ